MRQNHHVWKATEDKSFDYRDTETRILHNAKFDISVVDPVAKTVTINTSRQMGKSASFTSLYGSSSPTGRLPKPKSVLSGEIVRHAQLSGFSHPFVHGSYKQAAGRTTRMISDSAPINLEPGHTKNKVWECDECGLKVRAPYSPPPIDDQIRGYVPAKYVLMPLPGYERFPSCFSRIVRHVLED